MSECLDCGLCCKSMIIGVRELGEEDAKYWATVGRVEGDMCVANMRCRQLGEDNRCAIYDIRPAKCRNFEYAGAACQLMRYANGLKPVEGK